MGSEQAGLPGMTSTAEHEADMREREDDPTPRGVVRAVLAAASTTIVTRRPRSGPLRVLDVCAGWGCWASEIRRLAAPGVKTAQGFPVHITGVEIDSRKREDIRRWCDAVVVNDWREFIAVRDAGRRVYGGSCCDDFDLAIGNPHFTALTHDDPEQSMPAVLLRHAPAVLLFHQEQSFQKSEAGARIWHRYPPAAVLHVPGSVRFRVGTNPKTGKPYGADSRCYQATLWLRGYEGPASAVMLPWLPAADRRWSTPPGTETGAEAEALGLVEAPR